MPAVFNRNIALLSLPFGNVGVVSTLGWLGVGVRRVFYEYAAIGA